MSEFIEHKLIPVIKFKKMIQDCNNNNNNNDSVNNNDIEMKSDPEIKSVSQIRSKYNEPDIRTGEGLFKDKQSNLFWSLNDETKLPKYSIQNKIENSFNEYENILNSDIPSHLKIMLMKYYRQKYDNSKQTPLNEDTGVDPDENIENFKLGMESTILTFRTQEKRNLARNILVKLSQLKDYITWDKTGEITYPQIYLDSVKNLKDFISILIFAKQGSSEEIMNVYQVIEPFYDQIQSYIVNNKLKKLYRKNNKGMGVENISGRVKKKIKKNIYKIIN